MSLVLASATVVSLVINIVQVLTSLQDNTVSTVARLLATGTALFILMPWMWRNLVHYTLLVLSDFRVYLK